MEEDQIRGVIDQYNKQPQLFDGRDDDLESLEEHAHYYRIPFTRTKEHQDNYVMSILKNAGQGWAEGFSTLPLAGKAEPKDTWQAIANNLGHLAGFVGYLPGGRALKSLGVLKSYTKLTDGLRGVSVPMAVASKAQGVVGKAIRPILKDLPEWATSGIVGDMAQGAFHLGTASAVSSWTHGIDEIFHSAGFGAVAGSAFRGIGNMKGFGQRINMNQMKPNGSPDFSKISDGQKADLALRTMAGAAFQGLPSTLQGATTEEQVYAYAMGSFFGFKEVPYQTRTAREFLAESFKEKYGPDPEMNPKWDSLTSEMKEIVKMDFQETFQYSAEGPSETSHLLFDLLSHPDRKMDLDAIEKIAREYGESYEVDPVTGEINAKALSKKELDEYKEDFIKEGRADNPEDLDMHIQAIADIPGRLVGKNGYVEQVFPELSTVERIDIADAIFKKWKGLQNEDSKPIPGAEQKIISFIEENYGRKLTDNEQGWWRRWAETNRKKQWVEQVEIKDEEVGILNSKTNSAGNKKDLSQEPLIIQSLHDAEYKRLNGQDPDPQDHFFRVLDHVIFRGKEHDLKRAEQNIARQEMVRIQNSKERDLYDYDTLRDHVEGYAKNHMENVMKKLHEKMWEDGYYYFGGKGDAKKMFFVKIHPGLKKPPKYDPVTNKPLPQEFKRGIVKKVLRKIRKVLRDNGTENVRRAYREGRDEWKKMYPGIENANEMYDRMFVSNALYDLTNNGYSTKIKDLDAGLKDVLGPGFINDPKAFNKRAQIWFNSGLSANPTEIFKHMRKVLGNDNDFMGSDFRVGIFYDADGRQSIKYFDQKKLTTESEALKYTEITDGAIVARSEVVDALNLDKGLPTDGGMNKSFIVSPDAVNGALLGKYAIHKASPELEAYMRENKIHMLMPESAVKQSGKRKDSAGDLQSHIDYDTGEVSISFDGTPFRLPAAHFRTVMSEITTKKMLKPSQLPKQMYSVLSSYGFKGIEAEAMKDMYQTLSEKAIKGTPEGREKLEEYMRKRDTKSIEDVVENLEEIPINKLFELIRDPEHPKLSQKLYEKILKVNHEYVEALAEEGEVSRDELEMYKEKVADYESVIERLSKVFPDGSVGAYMHKFSRDYRMQAMRNYVVQKLTRPRIDNSASARMRPYEVGFHNHPEMAKLNTKEGQDMFFLDEGFRELVIKDDMFRGGRIKLGELWETREEYTGVLKDKIDQILHGLVMRVPMDSISGAHSLKFQGFTGVDGLGALLHPRTMKALGGADLDGDKATIFFGGESHGFKQKWREMYHGAKDEYVDPVTKAEKHNKEAIDPKTKQSYRDDLAIRDEDTLEKSYHPTAQYSPYWREFMSRGAYGGRDMLGVAVTRRMAVLGAYDAIRSFDIDGKQGYETQDIVIKGSGNVDLQKDGEIWVEQVILSKDKYSVPYYDNKDGVLRRLEFEIRKGDVDLQRFRELSRAAIALGSDPMDEVGLKGDLFETKIFDTLFKTSVYETNEKGVATERNERLSRYINEEDSKIGYLKKKGLHGQFLEANSLLYGKNHRDNRRWSYAEIQAGIHKLNWLPERTRNTFLPQLAESMKEINWSDNIFRHINEGVLNKIYFDHNEVVKGADWLKNIMGRESMATQKGRFIQGILDKKLYDEAQLKKLAMDEEGFIKFITSEFTRKDGSKGKAMGQIPWEFKPLNASDYYTRRAYLEHLLLKGEDFLVNDLSDMASLKSITDVIKKNKIGDERIDYIHKKSDEIKSQGVHLAKQRRALDDALTEHYEGREGLKESEELRKSFGLDDKSTQISDQIQTDKAIRDFKVELSEGERDLFDMLFMGTYQRADRERMKAIEAYKKVRPEVVREHNYLFKSMKNTSLVRAGLTSKEISDKNLKIFFTNYDHIMKKAKVNLSKEQEELLMREATEKEPVKSFFDEHGNKIKGEFVDANLINDKERQYLDEVGPFTGLYKGEIKDPELLRLYDSLTEHLSHYHNLDTVNLNGFFRGLFKKDINQATKVDLQQLDAVFKEMRDGTWWRNTVEWLTGKDKNPEIKKAYYWMFPKAIDRDLMRNPAMMEWLEDVGPFKDKIGNTIENARTIRPTSVIGEIQQLSARTQELSMQKFEEETELFREELRPYINAVEDGDILFKIAVADRELGYMKAKLRKEYKADSHNLTAKEMEYQNNWNETRKDFDMIKYKTYVIPTKDGNVQMTGEAIIGKINNIITKTNMKTHKWLKGDPEKIQEWLSISEPNGRISWSGLDKLRRKFHEYIKATIKENKSIPIEDLGIDGLRQIVKRVALSQTPYALRSNRTLNESRKRLRIDKFDETGDLGAEYYFPHMSFNRKKAKNKLKGAVKHIMENPNMTPEQKEKDIRKVNHQFKQLTGDFMAKDDMGENFNLMQDVMREMALGKKQKAHNILTNDLKRVGNQFSRDAHIGGWEMTPEAYEAYMKNAISTFYKQAMQLSARTAMFNFNNTFFKQTGDGKLTNNWMDFFRLYTQSAMGYPTHIPERIAEDPAMKIKGTAYKWLADSTAKKRIDFIGKKLGVGRKELERMKLDEETIDELSGVEYKTLERWGAREAKWQLASLLAHPKSSIANLYGGTVHTWISAGYDNIKKARNFEFLKTNINPKWNSMKDVEKWMQELGIIEEFLVYEAGLNPKLKGKKTQAFIKEASQRIRRDPNMPDEGLLALSKKHGLTERAFQAAASFMRIPERILRRDSFMAHYIQAKQQFGGAIKDYNSPFLINYAKKGVKGTQFLYSAPFRPLWTNSTLGRVMSRFQLWSWNSVRFRNDVIRRAEIAGYRQGTPEFETFKRLAMADLFMLGLSNVFAYSLFENALPAPWNWFQDTADWMFGDEKAKERAFYGSAIGPLQAVTPPALRLLPPMFKWMVSGDGEQLADYYLWTIPPFGRLARDIVGPGGAIENPYYAITKFTGLPVMQMASAITSEKKGRTRGKFIYG